MAAYEWVIQFSWKRAGDDFEEALIERLSERDSYETKTTFDSKNLSK